jgi:hypothetical protein
VLRGCQLTLQWHEVLIGVHRCGSEEWVGDAGPQADPWSTSSASGSGTSCSLAVLRLRFDGMPMPFNRGIVCKPAHRKGSQFDATRRPKVHAIG